MFGYALLKLLMFLEDQVAAQLVSGGEVTPDGKAKKEERAQGYCTGDQEHDHDLVLHRMTREFSSARWQVAGHATRN